MEAADSAGAPVRDIEAEFSVVAGRKAAVAAAFARLRGGLAHPPSPSDLRRLASLTPLLATNGGALAATLFSLLEETIAPCDEPWVVVEGLLGARDRDLAGRAVDLAAQLAESGRGSVPRSVVDVLGARVAAEGSPLDEPVALAGIARILRGTDPRALYESATAPPATRRLAARVLDLEGQPAPAAVAERLLGAEAGAVLEPYLAYTRATHLDLLCLRQRNGRPPPIVAALRGARPLCEDAPLRDVIATLGWPRVNLGLEVRKVVGVSVEGSLPFMVLPWEASLLEALPGARRVSESVLFVAHGGEPAGGPPGGSDGDAVGRFRRYNLAHADVLGDLLGTGPLDGEKVRRILERMDAIVGHFVALFRPHADECAILPGLYAELKGKILAELETQLSERRLSAELTRLVQSFEDPGSLGEVRSLHGLKRYLHQRGLRLAFRLLDVERATNRTVDVVAAAPGRPLRRVRGIEYVDFEPAPGEGEDGRIPYPVSVVAEGFSRQLLAGQDAFPAVRVFCYGNEVHYYLGFLNHPAFLRVDYAPPLQGGMADLEYFGVSRYTLGVHPNPSLDAIRVFFREMELDAQVEATRIHARYDKERALDLGDLCRKVEALFRLAPYLMDVDWTIGSLDLSPEAKRTVAEAWARSFVLWGVLPLGDILTRDRRGILLGIDEGPTGPREVRWSGEGAYADRFRAGPRAATLAGLRTTLKDHGLEAAAAMPEGGEQAIGQLGLEAAFLHPLREALGRGEIVADEGGVRRAPPDLFQREHEAVRFAEILASSDEAVAEAVRTARLVAPLERTLRFRTTGDLDGHAVERAALALRGEDVRLFVLRDAAGMVRLAFFTNGESPGRRRGQESLPWTIEGSTDAARLASLLRANGYLAAGGDALLDGGAEEAARTRELFRRSSAPRPPAPLAGDRVVAGLRASPGRVVGQAVFRTEGRRPRDFEGAVLVAPRLRPEDNAFLFRAAGIVSTGGGVLSHAGLIAVQLGKPALVAPGRWRREPDGSLTLTYRTPEYREERQDVRGFQVSLRRDALEREHALREGDLVVLDAEEGTLRCLGQAPETLALHEEFRRLGEVSRRLACSTEGAEVLALRGRQLRARYQVEKGLRRLADPVLARHLAYELLLGDALAGEGGERARAPLLALLLGNARVAGPVREHLAYLARELVRRRDGAGRIAGERLPSTSSAYEVLALRIDLWRRQRALEDAALLLRGCGLDLAPEVAGGPDLEAVARGRLEDIRAWRLGGLGDPHAPGGRWGARHAVREVERLGAVLGRPDDEAVAATRARIAREDGQAIAAAEGRAVLGPEDGGFELAPLVGWKAANLAEMERLSRPGLAPPWFVVTHRAFEDTLDAPCARSTLREAIAAVLRQPGIDDARRSASIRALWEAVELPEELCRAVAAAYRALEAPFVAVRSSGREEDAESAARAGEFDTFLFVQGERPVLDHLKRAWSGFWTERAIHNRAALDMHEAPVGGGVVVQRMVSSRVSGVLQTVNVAEGDPREMVVNAGLGLGEGIVSGAVAADHVVVSKEPDPAEPLRFRYVTADKAEKVLFDGRAGLGTVRVPTRSHERFRPALEYTDLCALVGLARGLEAAYGYPLDVEFGIEESRLWILQVRPVATFLSLLRETRERCPLAAPERDACHAV